MANVTSIMMETRIAGCYEKNGEESELFLIRVVKKDPRRTMLVTKR